MSYQHPFGFRSSILKHTRQPMYSVSLENVFKRDIKRAWSRFGQTLFFCFIIYNS